MGVARSHHTQWSLTNTPLDGIGKRHSGCKDEVEAGAKAALGGRSAAAQPDVEQEKRIKQLARALGRSHLQIEILKNVLGE